MYLMNSKPTQPLLVHGPNGRKWGRNPKQLTPEDLEAEGIKPAPQLAIMRAMCLDCRDADEVLVCARIRCPLWPYRLGFDPWKKGSKAESLKKARAAKADAARKGEVRPKEVLEDA
jgi:hypothetical protein